VARDHDIRTRRSLPLRAKRELILVGTGGRRCRRLRELAGRMAAVATVVFLTPSVFARDGNPLGLAAAAPKRNWTDTDFQGGYFRVIPSAQSIRSLRAAGRGIMDYTSYAT